MAKKPNFYVMYKNHMDPLWRRCWRRRLEFKGDRFASYADIDEYHIADSLALARKYPDYKFTIESVVVVREYLRRHPQDAAVLRRLAQTGRFEVLGSGDNIIDSNMVLGESIVRNFLAGLLWVEDHLGMRTVQGWRNDAFGNSAQLPQILRGCELPWVNAFSYAKVNGDYWRGLDGSTICTKRFQSDGWSGGCQEHVPCPACRGRGCKKCRGRGIVPELLQLPALTREQVAKLAKKERAVWIFSGEELLPNPELPLWTKKYGAEFVLESDFLPEMQDAIAQVDNPPAQAVHPGVELNPVMTGCYVSRIKMKQRCRVNEYALLGAETLCALAAARGAAYPRRELAGLWETLLFTMFHDAITSTHVDAAYEELMEMFDRVAAGTRKIFAGAAKTCARPARDAVSVFNLQDGITSQPAKALLPSKSGGVRLRDERGKTAKVISCVPAGKGKVEVEFLAEDVPPFSAKVYRISPAGPAAPRALKKPVLENRRFRVTADESGILSIYDKQLRRNLAAARGLRVGAVVAEHDAGSPWGTMRKEKERTVLAQKLVKAEAGEGYQRLEFACLPPEKDKLRWSETTVILYRCRTTVTLYEDLDRVDFALDVDWDAMNARFRIAMPLPLKGRHLYGIPYGALQRKEYAGDYGTCWSASNGDWPATDWAGIEAKGMSVALFNKGLPSYRLENSARGGTIWLSVLRSPTHPAFLHQPDIGYTMTDYDGMRDAGKHRFEYALAAYPTAFRDSPVAAEATAYNAGLPTLAGCAATLPPAPRVVAGEARISALKLAEKGKALIVRLWEFRGKRARVRVQLPEGLRVKEARKTNLLERGGEKLTVSAGAVNLDLRAWEIATLRLEL